MKQIGIFMVVAGLALTGCTKNGDSELNDVAIASPAKTSIAAPSLVYYKLAALPRMQDQQMQWNDGYMTISSLVFIGTHITGNMLSAENFSGVANKTVKLYEAADLGVVAVQPDTFDCGQFGLQLSPANGLFSLYLEGTFELNGTGIPVRVAITEQQMKLTANWKNGLLMGFGRNYTVTLMLNIYDITKGITSDMIANAAKKGAGIEISSTSNQDLYKIMVANLQDDLLHVVSLSTLLTDQNANIITAVPVKNQL